MANRMFPAGYSADEAIKIVAPLCGADPGHLDGYIVIGINTKRQCGHVGGTNNIPSFILPTVLRAMADQIEKEDSGDTQSRTNQKGEG